MMVSVKFVSVDSYQDFVNYLEARMQELLQGKDKKNLCF